MATRHSRRLRNRSPEPVTGPASDQELPPDSDHTSSDTDPDLLGPGPTPSDSDSISDTPTVPLVDTLLPGRAPPYLSSPSPITIPQLQPKPLPPVPPTAPPPDTLSSSDSSDDSDLEQSAPLAAAMPTHATVSHSNVTRPPQMSDGTVTPGTIQEFEQCAECFFLNAKGGIKDDQKVLRLLGCFANPLIRDWIAGKRTELSALTFSEFMKSFRKRWLPSNWEEATKTKMLSSRLEPEKEKFENWVVKIQKLNVALRGTSSYCDDAQLLTQLTLNLDPELRAKAAKTGPHKDLSTWIEAVTEIDRNDNKTRSDYMNTWKASCALTNVHLSRHARSTDPKTPRPLRPVQPHHPAPHTPPDSRKKNDVYSRNMMGASSAEHSMRDTDRLLAQQLSPAKATRL
jgi:hypothetical protein